MEASNKLHASAVFLQRKNSRYHWPGELVGPRSGLDVVENREIPATAA
jgi:hypothetical protein